MFSSCCYLLVPASTHNNESIFQSNKGPRALSRTSLTQQSATELIREFLGCCVISSRVFGGPRSVRKARVVQCNSCQKLLLDTDSTIHTIQRQQLMPQPNISAIYCVNLMEVSISLLPLTTQVKAQLKLFKMDVSFDCRTAKLSMLQDWLRAGFLRISRHRITCGWRSNYFVAEGR